MLSHLISSAQKRLTKRGPKWCLVYGPAAALVLTLRRLNWIIVSATEFISDDGVRVDLKVSSPCYVCNLVSSAVSRWRWRRIEDKFPALQSGGLGLGAAWRPIAAALRVKDSEDWGPEQKGALRSLLAGRQWTQQRLHRAGLVDSCVCRLCLDMHDGNQVGTLLHRCFCPALTEFRDRCMPQWIKDYLHSHGDDLSPQVFLALSRGLFSPPCLPSRDDDLFDTFHWTREAVDIPCGCSVFTDGSLLDGRLPTEYQSLGWSFVVLSPDGTHHYSGG